MSKAGRPTKYLSSYNKKVYKLCLLGATDKEIADFFEVNEDTINEWKKVHSKFSESIKKGKMKANSDVAESLYKRACGYEHEDTKFFCHEGEVISQGYTKHYPPDTGACMAFLKNRTRNLKEPWSDKQEHEHSGEVGLRHYNLRQLKDLVKEDKEEPDAIAE